MAEGLHLSSRHCEEIETLLHKHLPDVEVWAYGSRVNGQSHDGSDLDLVLRGPKLAEIDTSQLADFIEALQDSTIPFLVEARDWACLPESFHREIEREHVVMMEREERDVAGEWIHCILADACSAINYGLTASASNNFSGPKFLRITDIVSGRLDWNTVPHVIADDEIIVKYRLYDGDIVIARTGASTGASIYVKNPPPAVFASYLVRLQAKPDFDARFLAYYLKSKEFWGFIRGVLGDKSAQPNASASTMTSAPLSAPKDKTEQRAIAHILGTLDDKIELNRRMNETLESMARALFKSWFVDFAPVRAKMEGRDPGLPQHLADLFPDRMVESELGEIPEGWEATTLGAHIANFDSKRVPVSGAERSKRQGPFPYHGAAGVMDHIDNYLFDGIYLLTGEDGSVVRESGLAVTQYVWGKFWVNNHAHVLQGKGMVSTEQVYLYFHFEPVAPYVTGAVQPKLSQGRMNNMPFLFPGAAICKGFAKAISPWFARRRACAVESKTLAALRDVLLPKLISGEFRVRTAETFLERVL